MVDCSIPGNPDIAGIGVRIAIYIQNLLCFAPALWALWDGEVTQDELDSAETQTTTNLVLAFAILISSIVQALTLGLSNYHANIVLSMSWMNNTNVFIYFLLYIHHKRHTVTPDWRSWYRHVRGKMEFILPRRVACNEGVQGPRSGSLDQGDSPADPGGNRSAKVLVKRIVILLGSLHLSLMAGLGVWLWSDLLSFGNRESIRPNNCAATSAFVAIVGKAVPMGANALKISSLTLYSIFLIPGFNLILPVVLFLWLNFWYHQRSLVDDDSSKLQRKQWVTLPAFIGLAILLVINVIFIIDIEATLVRNKGLQAEGEEDHWGFGQILAVLLLFLPLRDLVETLLARRAKRFQKVRRREIAAELMGALRSKEIDAVVRAMERGADLNEALDTQEKSSSTEWLLWAAVLKGHPGVVAVLLQRPDLNVNLADEAGRTPLDLAYNPDDGGPLHREILRLLLQRADIDPNFVNSNGQTVLLDACLQGDESTVKLLLQHPKTNINQIAGGQTALLLASKAGRASIIQLLLGHADIDINRTVGEQTTALSLAMEHGQGAVASLLLQHPSVDLQGQSALFIGCQSGAKEVVKLLLEKRSLDLQNEDEYASLMTALENGHDDVGVLLLNALITDTSIPQEQGNALLLAACQGGADQSTKILLGRYYPDVSSWGKDSSTPLIVALENGRDGVAVLLLQHPDIAVDAFIGDGRHLLQAACEGGAEQSVKLLLERFSLDVNLKLDGDTPLMLALQNSHDALAARLLQQPDIDIHVKDWFEQTPLMIACDNGLRESARLLLEKDSSAINLQDSNGRTALMLAARGFHQDIVMSLLCHLDIRVDLEDVLGYTAAEQEGVDPEIRRLIEAHKATQQP